MEFFVMAEETDLINIKQKLNGNNIPYQIKITNNVTRMPAQLNDLFCRNRKNYYTILVKEEYMEKTKEILKQCGKL